MARNVLRHIAPRDVPNLMRVLASKTPYSAPVYHWIRMHRIWETKIPGMQYELLCPDGDWSRGQVVGICRGLMLDGRLDVVTYAEPEDAAELTTALRDSPLVEWARVAMLLHVVREPLVSLVRDVLHDKIQERPEEHPAHLFFEPAHRAARLTLPPLPEGAILGPLKDEHVSSLCRLWPHFAECYLPVMRAMVAHNASAGVFLHGELISMTVEAEHGGLGMGQTEPSHRGRGWARFPIVHLARHMAARGLDLHFSVKQDNVSSLRLMRKIDFSPPCGFVSHFSYI